MSIRKYIAYLRTVETGSITQAANELGYTQSAVSKMISDLEQDWQVKLLTRNHSGIEISSAGMVLLPTIREIVKDYEAPTILHDTMVAILPKDHPMADASVFPLEQLPHENFVRLMEIEDYEFNRLLDHYNIHPEVTYDTTSDFALLSMVEAGLGISIVHSLLIKPGRYRVATLPLNVKQSREIGIAVKKGFLPSTITQLFLQHVVDYTKDMGEITVIRH